jgi:hypothetical protein
MGHGQLATQLQQQCGEYQEVVWKVDDPFLFDALASGGMSQDNWGRLFSSNNARPLQTHLVPYGYSECHPFSVL